MAKAFLQGSRASESKWREELIPMLKVPYFCQMDTDLTEDERQVVSREMAKCDLRAMVVIPEHVTLREIADIVHHSFVRPGSFFVCVPPDLAERNGDLDLIIAEYCVKRGVKVLDSLQTLADLLNSFYVEPPPFSPYMVECTIERDGPTEIYQDGVRYFFEKNACGHYVCLVQRNDHRKRLCSIDGFRIYQKDKLPEPEFTEEEIEFMQTWRTMDKDSFAEFVNGRLREFRLSREKVRRIAIEKWTALHHRDKTPMPCPIDIPDDPFAVVAGNDPGPPADESESWTDEQWAAWTNTWVRLTADRFEKFVEEQETKLLNCPDDVWDRAKEKWAKLMPDKPWPIDPDGE